MKNKLSLNRETLKLLKPSEAARVQGGQKKGGGGVTSTKGCDATSRSGGPCSSGCPKTAGSGCC